MKMLLKLAGFLVLCLLVALVILRITGLSPKDRRPGLWLKGDLVTTPVTDWSFVEQYPTDQVQTQTWYMIPHSVNTGYIVDNGQMYLTSAFFPHMPYPNGKSWTTNVVRDPHVRLKFGNQLFDANAYPVTDPVEKTKILTDGADKAHQKPNLSTDINTTRMYLFHVMQQ